MTPIEETTVGNLPNETTASEEIAYVLGRFDYFFSDWRGKRIALHGVRAYARAIFEAFDDEYHFAAIVANDEDCGVRISEKEIWSNERMIDERPDLVILTERVRHAEAVYQEIGSACRERGIPLFDMYGLDWLAVRAEIDRQEPQSLQGWLALAKGYDVVSINLPDCLMSCRKKHGRTSLIPHPPMKRLVERLNYLGKRVLFIGRKPFTVQEQIDALEASGLVPADVSVCDVFYPRVGEDGAWHSIRADYPDKRILHLGFGIPKECILPRYYGADTYRVLGPSALTEFQENTLISAVCAPNRLKRSVEHAIECAQVVSFDLFDTLLMRTTLSPEDVFALVEQKAKLANLPAEGFRYARASVQNAGYGSTVDDYYHQIQTSLRLSDVERDCLKALEWSIEREVLVARQPICDMLAAANAAGKRVFVVSDMYYSESALAQLLRENGITGYEKLIVSCEHGQMKREGLLAQLLDTGVPAEDIVHIGDSFDADIEPAKQLGMRAVLVPSAMDIARIRNFVKRDIDRLPLDRRCKMGREIAEKFADPFSSDACIAYGQPKEQIPSALRVALLAWYPFVCGGRALFLGADKEAFASLLAKYFEQVDTEPAQHARYDCVVVLDALASDTAIRGLFEQVAGVLADDGTVIVGFRNRFALKYLCGGIDDVVSEPFGALSPGAGEIGLRGKKAMADLLEASGLVPLHTYYALPDADFTQAVYTDEFMPGAGIKDRVMPFDAFSSPIIAAQRDLYDDVVREGLLPQVADYCLVTCAKSGAETQEPHVVHAALSLDRGKEHSFITTLYSDGTAFKQAAYPEGRGALEKAFDHSSKLQDRGLVIVEQQLTEKGIRMPLMREQPLLAHIESLIPDGPDAIRALFDQLLGDIMKSSEQTALSNEEALRIWKVSSAALGPILRCGYIDMVPYNAFWADGVIRYFDQEFAVENCPARYILFRALFYTWIHLPHLEQTVSLESMKRRFRLETLWECFLERENAFVGDNRNCEQLGDIYEWAQVDYEAISRRRKLLLESTDSTGAGASSVGQPDGKPYGIGLLMGVFDLFHVGHLRLIKRAKKRCRFLRVAVLSDALTKKLKGIVPTIPLEQRMEILDALSDVDEVVSIDDDTSRLVEFQRRPFDCFFSGDDYAGNEYWEWERQELEKHGATIEFFSYTEEQSSTNIREKLAQYDGPDAS